MRINVLQHTPNEGPGSIQDWAHANNHELYIYHPYQFGNLPTADQTDLLVILGGPLSPNDDLAWIKQERQLIQQLLAAPQADVWRLLWGSTNCQDLRCRRNQSPA